MTALFDALRPFIRTVVRRAGWVIAIALLLTAGGLQQATQLTINPDIASLLPDDYPSVQALERLQETVGGESEVAVGITSPSFEANKQFAEDLIPKALDLQQRTSDQPYLTRVEYRRDTEFLENNALYLASNSELRTVEQFLEDQLAEAKQEANPFFVEVDEDEGDDEGAQELEGMYSRLVGSEYPVSADSTTMVL